MKKILAQPSLIERIIALEANAGKFYKQTTEGDHETLADLFVYMAKQKELDVRALTALQESNVLQTDVDDRYAEAFNLYVAPYLETGILADFTIRRKNREAEGEAGLLRFALEFEKEMVLLYGGMTEVLPGEAGKTIVSMTNQKRHNILALQDALKEKDAGIDDLLLVAFNRELLAKRFYLDAARRSRSETARRFFNEFADFEEKHAERIQKIIESRNQGTDLQIDGDAQLKSNLDPEIGGEVEPNKADIIDVMMMAVEAEKNANARYRRIASMLKDEEGKAIFTRLANDERTHQKLLEDQLYHMSNSGMIIWE